MSDMDPYYCIVCGHEGEDEGIIGIDTPCEKCGSVLIVPLNSVYIMQMDDIAELAEMLGELENPKKAKRHLTLVPSLQPEVTKNGTEDGGSNEEKE